MSGMGGTSTASGRPATDSIHGHTLLRWLSEAPMSQAALEAKVEQAFGSAPRFHTCDTAGLALPDLLRLLADRGKIVEVAGEWSADPAKICADA